MESYSWSLIKIVLAIFFVFFFRSSFSLDLDSNPAFWAYLDYFVNHTDEDYIVYKSCVPATKLEDREWQKLLRLISGDKKFKDNVGMLSEGVLLKDPLGNGCILKIAPADPDSNGQTFYIRSGLKSSGNCKYKWLQGPYGIEISPMDFILLEDYDEKTDDSKKPTSKRIRYCGYQTSILGVEIYANELKFVSRHRSYVIDEDKYSVYESEC